MDEVKEKLDVSLPPDAYKKIGGTSLDLTDIDAGWMRKAFNSIFGMCGYGWGMKYDSADVVLDFLKKESGKETPAATIKRLILWYILEDEGKRIECQIMATGSNKNEQGKVEYALKGALTNAIGNAASQMGWQESIYLGYRSHDNTTGHVPTAPKKQDKPAENPPVTPPAAKESAAVNTATPSAIAPTAPAVTEPPAPAQTTAATPSADEIKKDIEAITEKLKANGFKIRANQFKKMSEIIGREVKGWPDMVAVDRLKVLSYEFPNPNAGTAPSGVPAQDGVTTTPPTAPTSDQRPLKFFVCANPACNELITDRDTVTTCRSCKKGMFSVCESLVEARNLVRDRLAKQPAANPQSNLTKELFELAGRIGCKTPADAAKEVGFIVGREIKSSKDLTDQELVLAVNHLKELCASSGL